MDDNDDYDSSGFARRPTRSAAATMPHCQSSTPYKFDLIKPNGAAWPRARSGHRTFVDREFLYVIGGFTEKPTNTILRELWKFNLVSHKWTSFTLPADFPHTLASFACHSSINEWQVTGFMVYGGTAVPFGAELDEAVYMGRIIGDNVEIEKVQPLGDKPGCYGHVLVIDPVSDKAFSVGGTNGTDFSKLDVHALHRKWNSRVWEYEWEEYAPIVNDAGLYRMEAVIEKGRIYIVGGGTTQRTSTLETILAFNIERKLYEAIDTKPDPVHGYPTGRRSHSLVQWDERVIIAGGCYDDDNKNIVVLGCVWSFNLDTNVWSKMADLPIPVCFHDASITAGGKMHIFGGLTSSSGRIATLQTLSLGPPTPLARPVGIVPKPVLRGPEPKKPSERWDNTVSIGKVVTGTHFVAFKCPRDETFLGGDAHPDEFFLIDDVMESTHYSMGLVIDLTNRTEYYNTDDWIDYNVKHRKLFGPTQTVNAGENIVKLFNGFVDDFLEKNKDNDDLIGVHCTRGVNLTGYLVCRYLIDRMNWTADDAIGVFEECRGHPIEVESYKVWLREAQRRRDSAGIVRVDDAKTTPATLVRQSPPEPRALAKPSVSLPFKICSLCNKTTEQDDASGMCEDCLELRSLLGSLEAAEKQNLKSLLGMVKKCSTGISRDLLMTAVEKPEMVEFMLGKNFNVWEASVRHRESLHQPVEEPVPTSPPILQTTFTCGICFEDDYMDSAVSCVRATGGAVIQHHEQHHFCSECVSVYAENAVAQNNIVRSGIGLKCPSCPDDGVLLSAHVEPLLQGRSRELLEEKLEEAALAAAPIRVERCLREGCSWGEVIERCRRKEKTFTCGKCDYKYCRRCKSEWSARHVGKSCEQVNPEFARRKLENALSQRVVDRLHHCPICKKPIEKNGGCNKMICCDRRIKNKKPRKMTNTERAGIIQQHVAAAIDPKVVAELNKLKIK